MIFSKTKGDISLDDIALVEGECPTNDALKCNFELGLCGLQNDLTAQFNWTRKSGKFGYATGPTVDHSVIWVFLV